MILHLDMDAFFAAVEQLDFPELRGKPVIVGGRSARAVVSTASYEARVFGVRSAMPIFQARKLCPHGIYVRGRMGRYKEISVKVFELLDGFSPRVEPVSIDEAYMDITGCEGIFGPPLTIARRIKDRIREDVGLTCSIGIAPLKFLSKIASDMNKPDGITLIGPEEVLPFIGRLPVTRVPGVGASTARQLERMGVRTLGDLAPISEKVLVAKTGSFGLRLKELSQGIDRLTVTSGSERKSFSTETTLAEDTADRQFLRNQLLMQADDVARMLRKHGSKARTVTLKITFAGFRQITRRHTIPHPTQSSDVIYAEAVRLFDSEYLPEKLRLIGLGAAGLVPENRPEQTELFDDGSRAREEKWEHAERAVDSVLKKFGNGSLSRAVHNVPKKGGDAPDQR
jgi:DNA polymerase-4